MKDISKLEFKHLSPYLPYSLMIESPKHFKHRIMGGMINDNEEVSIDAVVRVGYKPILIPLSKLIESKYEMPNWRKKAILFLDETSNLPYNDRLLHMGGILYTDMLKLFEWHMDVFGLIPKGIAVNGSL